MQTYILTIFPEYFKGVLETGLIKNVLNKGLLEIKLLNLRDFTDDAYRTVDDYPYGGGHGMIMKPEPIFKAVFSVRTPESKVILLSPQGRVFNQSIAFELSRIKTLILLCGRYKGVDGRVVEHLVDEEISIGDYILSGGEAAACVILDAVSRLLEGAVGKYESVMSDSFVCGLLDATYYTRPQEYLGYKVPEELISGDHEAVRRWRRKSALLNTLKKRPDLLAKAELTPEDQLLLSEIKREIQNSQ